MAVDIEKPAPESHSLLRAMVTADISREGAYSSFMIRAGLLADMLDEIERYREALGSIGAFKTSGPSKPGQIKGEHRAMIIIARAALSPTESGDG